MRIFGTLVCNCYCENCVITSGKLKIRTNYCQSVPDCFVCISVCDCDVTVVGLRAELGLTNQRRPRYNHGRSTERDQLIQVQLGTT